MELASLAPALNNQGPSKRHNAFHVFVLILTAQNYCISDLSGWETMFPFVGVFFSTQQRLVKGECSGRKEGGRDLEPQWEMPQEEKEGVMSRQGRAV